MRRTLDCGCTIDDQTSSILHQDAKNRSTGDQEKDKFHYPLFTGPETFCISCDLSRPCMCDQAQKLEK